MGKIAEAEPTTFSHSDAKDSASIDLFRHLLDKDRARHDGISSRDTFPNIDGRVIMTTTKGESLGEIQVQVKTLDEDYTNTPKYQCKIGFLAYCYRQKQVPVILTVVDNKNSCAYWLHMDKKLLTELDEKITGDSIMVHFPKDQIVSKNNLAYVEKWQGIVEEQDKFLTEAAELSDKYLQLTKHVENLSKITGEQEINENVFVEIHKFLDYLNQTWDREFSQIKQSFYPSVWKFGIGYSTFSKDKATLSLYPIMYNNNVLPIKKFSELTSLSPDSFRLYSFGQDNPILSRPWEFAHEIIQDDVLKFLKERRIVSFSKILLKEYIFAFIDEYWYLMGLEQKAEYPLKDLADSITITLYQNAHRVLSQHQEFLEGPFFNIDKIKFNLHKSEIDRCLALPFVKQDRVMLKTGSYNVPHIIRLISYLNDIDEQKLSNIYPLRLHSTNVDVFQKALLTNEERINRVKGIYENFAQAYDDFIYFNFEYLQKQLSFFQETDLMIVVVDPNDTTHIHKYKFKTLDAEAENEIKVVEISAYGLLDYTKYRAELHAGIEIDGKKRKLISYQSEVLRIDVQGTPLLDLVHEEAIKRLKTYFALHIRKEKVV